MPIQTSYLVFVALFDLALSLVLVPYVPYLLSLGLTLGEVSLINACFLGAAVIAEIPTGLFADRVSRAYAVRLGTACIMVASCLYAAANGFLTALLYEVLIGIGLAFTNGALGSWLRDMLIPAHAPTLSETDYSALVYVYERAVITASVMRAGAVIVGGVLGWEIACLWGYRMGWLIAAVCMGIALVWNVFCMPTDRFATSAHRQHALSASWRALSSRSGLWWVVGVASAYNFVTPFNHFWTPFLTGRLGEEALGWSWIILQLPLMLASYVLRRMKRRITGAGSLVVILAVAGSTLTMITYVPGTWSLVPIVLHEGTRGCYAPLLEIFTQRRIDGQYRATYMSLQSFFARCGGVVVLFTVWLTTRDLPANEATISLIWSTSGSCLVVCALALWFFRPRT